MRLGYVVFTLLFTGCGMFSPRKPVTKYLENTISTSKSGIVFGGEKKFIVGYITSVRSECLPLINEPLKPDKSNKPLDYQYDVAVTADVSYTINDTKLFEQARRFSMSPSATVRFEVLADSGVVLGHASGVVSFILNGTTETVSAKIKGLSEHEIKRASRVVASWQYS